MCDRHHESNVIKESEEIWGAEIGANMQQPKEQPMTARKLYREIIGLREELFTERSRMIRLESRTQKLATQILALARPAAGGNSNGNR